MIDARNLWELLDKRVAATPDAVMAVDEAGATLTFAAYRAAAERAAAGLARQGIVEGDVVSWQLPTWLDSLVLVAALSRLGAIQNPMLPIYRQREVGFITKQAGSRLLIVPGTWRNFDYEQMAREIAAGQPGLEILIANRALPQGDPQRLPPPPATPDDPAALPTRWYYYTSGTTADPKGAQHTDATIKAAAIGMCERLEVVENDRIGCVFPFTHVAGAVYIFSALAFGCTMIVVEGFDAENTPPVLAREGVTLAGAGTPFHMAYLAYQRNHPESAPLFPEARAFIGGGAPKPPQLHYDIKAAMGSVGIVSGYGMTEAPIVTMASVRDGDDDLANTEGAPVTGVDLITVKLDGSRSKAGEEGEIRLKAPMLMRGYIDSALDAEAFDENGYFRTGDVALIDERGNVRMTGRVKDIIIRNMENISAKELEDNLFAHPKVADVAVIGLPDERTGERACAVVVAADAGDAPTLDELCAYLLERGLMKQKLPEQLEFIDALPRNPTGKVLKFELRDRYAKP
ncbi:MAG TPA: AMP-binding protein [Acidimicrobiales bacterium]|jgi:acyl-CoA synthetase (AMP-forming)/AMP-acid ligase II|nr:AMP-binding protein [Acidimicrobiales bacterium]